MAGRPVEFWAGSVAVQKEGWYPIGALRQI